MKSFDRWFADSARELESPQPGVVRAEPEPKSADVGIVIPYSADEDDLPEGLSFASDGLTVMAECRHCHHHYQYDGDLEGFDYHASENSCGSRYCMP